MPLNWMLVYNMVIAALNLLVPISYSWVERCTVRVMSLARFKPGPLDIGIYYTNHWATIPYHVTHKIEKQHIQLTCEQLKGSTAM